MFVEQCALMKRSRCALIGACALIRTNTVTQLQQNRQGIVAGSLVINHDWV